MKRGLALVPGLALALVLLLVPAVQSSGVGLAPLAATALGTAFTYQGQLQQNGQPVTGTCDVQFGLFDALSGGNPVGSSPQTVTSVAVTGGLFTVTLDFGANAFTGNAAWLEIAPRCPAGSGGFATLIPRQALTPTPNAVYASSAGNALQLGGVAANQYVLTTDPRLSSTNYILNGTALQSGANFHISGNGTLGGVLSASQAGIGTTSPTLSLGLGGGSARTIGTERNPTANSAGNSLTATVQPPAP
jgi:hypothetical protein